ncbi:kinase-like domain-containing protein [Nemania sp. NC0429]|nr:kinase-like domain-containing protein [Nemania sp. NC0429]
MSLSDPFPASIGNGVVLELQDLDEKSKSLVPTEPFPAGYIERQLEIDIGAQTGASEREDGRPDHSIHDVKCLAIHESPEHTSYSIRKPLFCDIYLGPLEDSVGLINRSNISLDITPLASGNPSKGEPNKPITIPARSAGTLKPGAWAFSQAGRSCTFQALVFPCRYVLGVVAVSMQVVAGHKRDATTSQEDATSRGAATQPVVENPILTRRLGCLSEMVTGEHARLYAPAENEGEIERPEFYLSRMKRLGNTDSAVVFQARHSGFAGQVIVVKALKPRSGRDLISRGGSWEAEMRVHLRIHSDQIVKLLGGDARIHVLFLENIDAWDLSHEKWYDRDTDHKFRGTRDHAQYILYDMARALQYLRKQEILHNDIKPPNILFNGKKAVLIDFGLGTFDGSRASNGGTPWYVPPEYSIESFEEQKREAPSDIWALGIVMLYALRRIRLPEAGLDVPSWLIKDVGTIQSVRAQMGKWLRKMRGEAEEIAAEDNKLGGIISRMLQQRSQERITADQLVSAMKAFIDPKPLVS